MKATTREAYQLLHSGSVALAQVERNGLRVDVDVLDRAKRRVGLRMATLEEKLKKTDEWKLWRREFGDKANLGSRPQLGQILYGKLGLKSDGQTKTGRPSVDEEALLKIDLPFVKELLKLGRLDKDKGTYLSGIRREVVDGFLHPFFNLGGGGGEDGDKGGARSFRGSSDRVNFQNIPVRDPVRGKAIRQAFIPRAKENNLTEIDFKGIEVAISCCYHHDPVLIEYVSDPKKDMHRDMAGQLFILKKDEISKEARYYAKNQFVFPQFYGSYYIQCAPGLWESIEKRGLKVVGSDMPMKEHLALKGVKKLGICDPKQQALPGTFEKHVKDVEKDFWGRRFKVYSSWKEQWWKDYQKVGGFGMLTGFWIEGVYARNQVVNYPIQGVAFHCLLWTLIRLQNWLNRKKMKTLIVGQIHDSMLLDGPRAELPDVVAKVDRIVKVELPQTWPWLAVPLAVEVETSETNWFEKKPYLWNAA